jgi:hypothetical protein
MARQAATRSRPQRCLQLCFVLLLALLLKRALLLLPPALLLLSPLLTLLFLFAEMLQPARRRLSELQHLPAVKQAQHKQKQGLVTRLTCVAVLSHNLGAQTAAVQCLKG